jgi:hypothetical protein
LSVPSHRQPFTLQSAARADAEGQLARWVVDFLASPGSDNRELAAALGFDERIWAGPILVGLEQLEPLAGPDGDVLVPVDETQWEDAVDDMVESLEDGWDPPPLLVSYRLGRLFLEDGNHRWETMRRAGRTHGWVVIGFDSEADRDAFLATRPTRATRAPRPNRAGIG